MPEILSISCPNCGATISRDAAPNALTTCDYCGTTFRVPASLYPEPAVGDLLLGADFSKEEQIGWRVLNREHLTFKPGSPPELWVKHPNSKLIHPVLRTPGPFDDFDVSITIRFLEGNWELISAGFEVRSGDDGDYIVRVSAQGTFQVGWHVGTDWGGALVNWSSHPVLRTGVGDANRLRVNMRGERMRVYLNGVLAASLRDSRFPVGLIRLVVSPGSESAMKAAFADLQLREA